MIRIMRIKFWGQIILPEFFTWGSLGITPVVPADPVRFSYSCYLEHPALDVPII
jgi:hypothetical protein